MQWIGMVADQNCFIDDKSINSSVLVTGISGSGKTTRVNRIELAAIQQGKQVVILDFNNTHAPNQIWSHIQKQFSEMENRIDPLRDGCDLDLFRIRQGAKDRKETYVYSINSAVSALSAGQRMGTRQIGALRIAVEYAMNNRHRFANDSQALSYALAQQDTPYANAVYEKMWCLLNSGALNSGRKHLQRNCLNIIDLGGMDSITKQIFAELFLSVLWRNLTNQNLSANKMMLVLDEFQNLCIQNDSVLEKMLTEGRKFGLQLLLSTQTLGIFPKDIRLVLNQIATRLYFRPAQGELQEISKMLDFQNPYMWRSILSKLNVGEAVAKGDLSVGGKMIQHPIVTK